MTAVTEHISELLYSRTPSAYREIQFGIADDLSKCADSREVAGLGDAFWEEMFLLYRSGVWPCGWDGKWPEGRIIVFDPLARGSAG